MTIDTIITFSRLLRYYYIVNPSITYDYYSLILLTTIAYPYCHSTNNNNNAGTAALHRLSSTGDAVSLKQFLAEFVGRTDEVNVDTGDTALHSAAQAGYQDTVRCLLEKFANVNAVGWYNETALHRAAGNGHLEVVMLLKEFGATMDVFNEDGSTPFALACLHGNEGVVQYMFENGASPSLHNLRTLGEEESSGGVTIGWTPISAAASRGT